MDVYGVENLKGNNSSAAIKEYLSETVNRIRSQKRALELQKLREAEQQRALDQAFRNKWKESVKEKRNRQVVEKIDDELCDLVVRDKGHRVRRKKGILEEEDLDIENENTLSFLKRKIENQNNLYNLIGDLVVNEHMVDRRRDSGEYKISFPNNMSSKQASFKFTSGGEIPSSIKYLHRIGAFGLKVRDKLDEPWERQDRLLNDNSNKLQLGEMLSDLLNIQSLKKDDILNVQRLPSGMMLKIIQGAQQSWFKPSRAERSPSIHLTNIQAALRQQSAREEGQPLHDPLQPPKKHKKEEKPKNLLLGSLIEKIFIVGPDYREIENFLLDAYSTRDNKSKVFEKFKDGSILPSILFQTENPNELDDYDDVSYPPEMVQQLPGYCYPRLVDIQLRFAPNMESSPNLRRSITQSVPSSTTEVPSRKKSKFFGADYNIFSGDKQDDPTTDLGKAASSKSITISFSHSEAKSDRFIPQQPFILQLGDHTYQNYCLAQSYVVAFVENSTKTVIHTTYTLCTMTRFPFFSYLSYIIRQYEMDSKFMKFDSPLPKFDIQFPLNSQLRIVQDLYHRLHTVKVQIFPFLSSRKRRHRIEAATNEDIDSNDCVAIVQDVYARISLRNQDRKLMDFKRSLYQVFYSSHARSFEDISDGLLANIKFQEKLERLRLEFVPTSLHKAERDKEESFLILQWTLPTLLKSLPLDQVVLCLGCAMTEMKIIVKHKELSVASSIILAIQRLLRPLKWCSPVIVTVTEEMMDLVESPVPIILGMQTLPARFELLEGYVVVDPEVKTVHLHPSDIVQSHTTLLPNASMLVRALTPHANTIKELWRKRKIQNQKVKITPTNNDLIDNGEPVPPQVPNPADFIPLELDITDPAGIQFSGAVKEFSSIVSTHILAIINTGIQLQQREKEEARDKRRIATKNIKGIDLRKNSAWSPPRNNLEVPEKGRSPLPNENIASPMDGTVTSFAATENHDVDDSVSELTVTDVPTSRGSNEIESVKGDSSGGASIASSTSSLPSLRSDAPVLREHGLGQTGLKFIRKVIDTQMYSNYCQSLKVDDKGFLVVDGSVINVDLPYLQQQSIVDDANDHHSMQEKQEDFDSLLAVFEIMTSGTIAMGADEFELLKKNYLSLYKNEMTREKLSRQAPAVTAFNKSIGLDLEKLNIYKEKVLMEIAKGKKVVITDIEKAQFKYCTGLLCQGDCNTDMCSEICVNIWEKKVRLLRRRKAAYETVSAKYEKQAKIDTSTTSTSLNGGVSRIEFVSKDGVRLEPIRHGKETESQYRQRKEAVSQDIMKKIRPPSPIQSTSSKKRRKPIRGPCFNFSNGERSDSPVKEPVALRGNEKRSIKKHTFASGDCDEYTYALAQYYANKERKLVEKHLRANREIVYRFVRRYVAYCRRVNFKHCVIYCQAFIRGFLFRNKLSDHIESLYNRKQTRFMAKLIIRTYIRNHIEQVCRGLERWKDSKMMIMKRRSSLNVRRSSVPGESTDPTASVTSASAVNISLVQNNVNVSSMQSKFINEPSLDEFPKDQPPANVPSANTRRPTFVRTQMQHYINKGVPLFRSSPSGSSPANMTSRLTASSLRLPFVGMTNAAPASMPATSPKAHPMTTPTTGIPAPPNSQTEALIKMEPMTNNNLPPKYPTIASSKIPFFNAGPQDNVAPSSPGTPKTSVSPPHLEGPVTPKSESSSPTSSLTVKPISSDPQHQPLTDSGLIIAPAGEEAPKSPTESEKSSGNASGRPSTTAGVSTLSAMKSIGGVLADRRSENNSDNDNESVSTAHKSVNHSQRHFPSSASVVSSSASVVTTSNISSSKGVDPAKRTKKTPFGRITEANNYAVSNVVASSGAVRAHSRSTYGSNPKSSDGASMSSRSFTNTLPDDATSTADGESRSDHNTLRSSEKSDGDDEKSISGQNEAHESPQKIDSVVTTETKVNSPQSMMMLSDLQPVKTLSPVPLVPPSINQPSRSQVADHGATKFSGDESPPDLSPRPISLNRHISQDDFNYDDEAFAVGNDVGEYDMYPMKTFGSAGQERFTSQQIGLIKNLYDLLKHGVEVQKYSRSGSTSKRYLYCNTSMTALYWRHHVKKDNEDFEEDMNPKVKQRRSSLINRKVDADRKVWIRDILEVNNHFSFDTPGQRSKLRDHHAILGMKTTADQKLDLEIEKSIWDQLYPALQVVVEFYNQEHAPETHGVVADAQSSSFPASSLATSVQHQHPSSFADLFNNQPFPEEIPTTSTTPLGMKADFLSGSDPTLNMLEYDTAGKRDKTKK